MPCHGPRFEPAVAKDGQVRQFAGADAAGGITLIVVPDPVLPVSPFMPSLPVMP